jgi:hypothetical protein
MKEQDQTPEMKDYMVEFYDFEDKRQIAMVSGTDEVNACENAESDYDESLAQISKVMTLDKFLDQKQEKARDRAKNKHQKHAKESQGITF